MITYKWTFTAFDCILNEEGMKDVVSTIHWRYKGTDEDGVSSEIYSAQSVNKPSVENFTPYSELTEQQVINWMENILDVEEMNKNIASQINLIKNPVEITLTPSFVEK